MVCVSNDYKSKQENAKITIESHNIQQIVMKHGDILEIGECLFKFCKYEYYHWPDCFCEGPKSTSISCFNNDKLTFNNIPGIIRAPNYNG